VSLGCPGTRYLRCADPLMLMSPPARLLVLSPAPPGAALFPYTTLFRSVRCVRVGRVRRGGGGGPAYLRHPCHRLRGGGTQVHLQDRKSTRLNSSHGSTS